MLQNKRQNLHLGWIDLTRVVSAIMVIAIHVCWHYSEATPANMNSSYWLFTNFLDTFFRCAVPLFFMMSGYLILRKPNSLKHGYVRRLLKIIIPLIVWSIIYLIARNWALGLDRMNNPINVYNGIRCLLTGQVSAHFWFLYVILSLYLVAPILHSYLKSASRENKTYFLLLWGCACFVWPILSAVLRELFDIDRVNFRFLIVDPTVGYFVAGYFLGNQRTHLKYAVFFFASFVGIASIITWIGFVSSTPYNMRFHLFGFLVIPLVLMLFYMLKHVGNTTFYQQSGFSRLIAFFAPLTFGVYIVHILIMHFLGDGVCGFSLNIGTFPPWVSIPLTVAAVFFMSAFLVWTLKKIPCVHWILP